MIRILLADDHAIMREGLRSMLASRDNLLVVASVSDGREALREARELRPDVVIMDIAMPGLNGIEATALLRESLPEARVIILSMHDSTEHVHRALRAGAQAYLLKESTGWELVDAVRAVCAGRRYLSRRIDAPAMRDLGGDSPLESLSQRERQILQLVAEGHSSAEIGRMLSLSPKTVDSYRSRLMQKLGLGDVPSLVKFAIRFGLTRLE